jgi:hypothetical protein
MLGAVPKLNYIMGNLTPSEVAFERGIYKRKPPLRRNEREVYRFDRLAVNGVCGLGRVNHRIDRVREWEYELSFRSSDSRRLLSCAE